jgi:uncharacterized protein
VVTRVVHFDVYADEVERAIAFYQTIFGWSITKVEGMDYCLIKTGEGDLAPMVG